MFPRSSFLQTRNLFVVSLSSRRRRPGNAGGLAERRAHGREVERAAQRPSEVLQGPGLPVGAGHRAHQAAQQVRGASGAFRSHPSSAVG